MRIAAAVVMVFVCNAGLAVAQTQSPPAAPTPAAPPASTTPPPATTAPPAPTATTPAADVPVMERVLGRILTLDDAVAIALETQPNIQARLYAYAAARYRVDQAFSPLLPQLTANWTASRLKTVTAAPAPLSIVGSTLVPSGGSAQNVSTIRDFGETNSATISLSQLLFDFGKNFATTEATRKLADVAFEDVELQRQLITLTVKESYTNINFAQRLIRVQEQALERANLNLRSAQGFFQVGTRPKSDVTRAEVDVANARVDLIRARNAEKNARVALNTAMGIPATTPTQVQDNLVYAPSTLDSRQLYAVALQQRPEMRQARLRVDQADALARRSVRDFFPDITGSGTYGGTRSTFNEIWTVTLNLTWSIFDGGNRIARYREAKANWDSARATVSATELDISRDVEQAVINVEEANERIGAAQTAVASAQENFRLAQGRFDAGVGTILELTDAQLALTQAQNTETQALADYQIALARLDRAAGRR
jgi:outer membrane protein